MDAPTVGVEVEFLLVDPRTGAPTARNEAVAHTAGELGIDLQLELTRCQVETSTAVHSDIGALFGQLRDLRCGVARCAQANESRLLAVAIPPTVPHEFPVTDTPRYRRIAESFGMIAHEQGLCGCHVHVAVPDRETAVQVSNYLRPWLPMLLALTANSAIYRGSDTGYASWRSILWRRWPSAGPPPYFRTAADYDAMVTMMLSSGIVLDEKMVYWDARPSINYPTIEVRVSDVPATVGETVLLAALVRATVHTARRFLAEGNTAPAVPAEVLRAAYWKAARSGIGGDAVAPLDGRVLPARDLLDELLETVDPALEELGDRGFVSDALTALFARGNGAQRQVRAFGADHDVAAVIAELGEATLEGCAPEPANSGGGEHVPVEGRH
ncbi:putative glutamate--cysteine ligase 2 [Nocardia farcinica]|uniref:glutamate--cysteine ligase 2 n=1 Tax=Nocardia farcinica TaxID=37329 RepID=UPI000BF4D0EE|nr:glutamate--cysteine ligase [Nocardia farcinica]PFX04650.1 putative glutamate--cysteine ligase 2 [Nocardia farcinica]PFX09759.1 putative glutamate--cysteine ligase 2 [Nocardia farcinica]